MIAAYASGVAGEITGQRSDAMSEPGNPLIFILFNKPRVRRTFRYIPDNCRIDLKACDPTFTVAIHDVHSSLVNVTYWTFTTCSQDETNGAFLRYAGKLLICDSSLNAMSRRIDPQPSKDIMDVATWLGDLGIERHKTTFRDNLIDIDVIHELTENDLEKLHFPLGDHKRVLKGDRRYLPTLEAAASTPIATPPQADRAEQNPTDQIDGSLADLDRSNPNTAASTTAVATTSTATTPPHAASPASAAVSAAAAPSHATVSATAPTAARGPPCPCAASWNAGRVCFTVYSLSKSIEGCWAGIQEASSCAEGD